MKKQIILLFLVLFVAAGLFACNDTNQKKEPLVQSDNSQTDKPKSDNPQADTDTIATHKHSDACTGHHHGGHSHEGQPIFLGKKTINDLTVKAIQTGYIKPKQEAGIFSVKVSSKGKAVIAVRMIVTSPEGETSLKAKSSNDGNGIFHCHIDELPEKLGAGSKLRVELELGDGEIISYDFEIRFV